MSTLFALGKEYGQGECGSVGGVSPTRGVEYLMRQLQNAKAAYRKIDDDDDDGADENDWQNVSRRGTVGGRAMAPVTRRDQTKQNEMKRLGNEPKTN